MDEGADTGDIVSQVKIPICESDYAADLYENIMCAAKNRYWNLQKTWKWKLQNNFTEEAGGKYMEEAWTQGWHN